MSDDYEAIMARCSDQGVVMDLSGPVSAEKAAPEQHLPGVVKLARVGAEPEDSHIDMRLGRVERVSPHEHVMMPVSSYMTMGPHQHPIEKPASCDLTAADVVQAEKDAHAWFARDEYRRQWSKAYQKAILRKLLEPLADIEKSASGGGGSEDI